MDLIRFETILEFLGESRVTTPAQSIYKALSNVDIPKEQRPREPGVRIRDEKQKHAIRWNYNSCGILYEDTQDHAVCIKNTITVLDKINRVAPIAKLSLRKLIIFWVLPAARYNFKSLESKYRENFIKQSTIFDNCVDSSVVIDMKCDKGILHHQSGAMDIAQLQRSYKTFKMKEQQPKLFIFLETTITNGKVIEYSSEEMSDFLFSSFEICKSHSTSFQKMMEVVL